MKYKKSIISLSLIALSLVAVGNSTWIVPNYNVQVFEKKAEDAQRVAYTYENNLATYYTTIESALRHTSSGTVYVIPGTNPTIIEDCEIKSGVTLCIPYDDNGDGTHSDYTSIKNKSIDDNGNFADRDETSVNKYRKNLVTIAKGVVLTNNGTLEVAGTVGVANNTRRPTGLTVGDYCEIVMQDNAKIQNNGKINLYGYIKESATNNGSSIENSSGASVKAPFVIYDFRGGSYSKAANGSGSMPFNYYDFPNCHVNQIFNYGSKLEGVAVLYTLESYQTTTAMVLGTESDTCLFKLSNGRMIIKYTPLDCRYTTADVSTTTTSETANYTHITIEGDMEMSSLSLSISLASFDTSTVECPICYKYQIVQKSGTLTLSNKMKFLSGSSLTIDNGASCIMNAAVSFYQGYMPIIKSEEDMLPRNMGRAKLLVNGSLTIGAAFGGVINTEDSQGIVTTTSSFEDSVATVEVLDYAGDKFSAYTNEAENHIESAQAYIGTAKTASKLEKDKTYQLKGNYWTNSISDISGATLSLGFAKSEGNTAATYTVKVISYPVDYKSTNLTYSWTISDTSLTLTNNGDGSVTFTTPATSSSDVKYTLTCTFAFKRSDGVKDSYDLSGQYTALSSSSCILPTAKVLMADGSYKLAGLIKTGDMVMSFNHETGKVVSNLVIGNDDIDKDAHIYNVIHLEFDNGKMTDLVYEHGYFDLNYNKYIYIREDNYLEYIGHAFVFIDDKLNRTSAKLVKATIIPTVTKLASPATANHLNFIVDDMLSIGGGLDGLFNIFEYDFETLVFDAEKMKTDIDEYGLLDYGVFEKYFPKKIYDLLPCKYLGVSIGKGLITWPIFESYVEKWKEQLMENMPS